MRQDLGKLSNRGEKKSGGDLSRFVEVSEGMLGSLRFCNELPR